MLWLWKYRKRILLPAVLVLSVWYALSLPNQLFNAPNSTVIYASDHSLLGARIAADEQWRFPKPDSVAEKFEQCILYKEDRYFKYHPGVNPVSIFRALYLNLKAGEVVSGGSTITMQVIRLSRGNPPRTIWEKLKETVLATRLELAMSKEEILEIYAAHAPFGGNVVGYEAASWRYFNRSPYRLSWAESAALAVLPNAPGLIHPGRNSNRLQKKRDGLLKELFLQGVIDQQTYELSLLEPLPDKPYPLPNSAPHLIQFLMKEHKGARIQTRIDPQQQHRATQTLNRHLTELSKNNIRNGSILLINNHSGSVEAYVGNGSYKPKVKGFYNDMIRTPRSSGSILKPFLYASMLNSGELLPDELIEDVPVFYKGFKPENFNRSYDGAVPASQALSRSLNIPAVKMLKRYSTERFLNKLHRFGFAHMPYTANHYGLSLILGGAEVTAWDLGRAYYGLAASLNKKDTGKNSFREPSVIKGKSKPANPVLGPGAIWQTLDVLTTVNRPNSEMGWRKFGDGNIAWKTGTSYGLRDAWAVGVTPGYTCVVWIGNSDGEGRPGLVGARSAGPVLFDFMKGLPKSAWFGQPYRDMTRVKLCKKSGLKAGRNCPEVSIKYIPRAGKTAPLCTYHRSVFVNSENLRVTRKCATNGEFNKQPWFVLPPVQAWYYRRHHPNYKPLPQWKAGCGNRNSGMLAVIYPQERGKVFIPKELDGKKGRVILQVAHQKRQEPVYWHLNGKYIGKTAVFHEQALNLSAGNYLLIIEDNAGYTAKRRFRVVSR